MKNFSFKILVIVAAASVTLFSSCKKFRCVRGSGNVKTESRKVSDFTKIDVSGGFKVTLKQDSSLAVGISADDNLLKYIQTSVSGGKLRIKTKRNICGSGEITITIGMRNLEEIDASGAVEVRSDGLVNTSDLNIDLSGSTKVNLNLNARNVHTGGSGSTEIFLKGQAASHNIDLSGSGKVEALDFIVGKYNIETSGATHCKINVLTDLSVHTSGASEIEYKGSPTKVTNDQSGASSIKKIE
jgi:hypothetical protein